MGTKKERGQKFFLLWLLPIIPRALHFFLIKRDGSGPVVYCQAIYWQSITKQYWVVTREALWKLFPYKDRLNRSQMSNVVYQASYWDCQDFYIGKTKCRLLDRKTNILKQPLSGCHASAVADHVTSTGHNLKWDHFTIDILPKGRSDTQCKIKETIN